MSDTRSVSAARTIESLSMGNSSGSDAYQTPSEVIITCRRRRIGFAQRAPVFGMDRPASRSLDARSPHRFQRRKTKSRPMTSGGFKWLLYKSLFLLFFQGDGDRTDGGEPHLVAFNAGHQATIDIVVMPLVRTFSTVLLGQLDPVAFDLIDGADVNAVGADDFHVLLDVSHCLQLPWSTTPSISQCGVENTCFKPPISARLRH